MWFDISAAIERLQTSDAPRPLPLVTGKNAPRIAEVAEIAGHRVLTSPPTKIVRSDGFDADTGAYLDFLRLADRATYGAAAMALGWGATRAWQAEAQIVAARAVKYEALGRAIVLADKPLTTRAQS